MKLGEAPSRRDGQRENRFEGAARAARSQPVAPANTAMAGAFARLSGLRK